MIVDPRASLGAEIWRPSADVVAASNVTGFIDWLAREQIASLDDYHQLWEWSVEDVGRFWESFARFTGVDLAGEPAAPVADGSMPDTQWFAGRTVNFAEELMRGKSGVAMVAVGEDGERAEISWSTLRAQVAALSQSLRKWGIVPGDRVVAVLPNIPAAVVAFLAAATVGAVWSVCAPEFGSGAIISRFAQLEPRLIIACPGYRLGGRDRDRGSELSAIIEALPALERVVWVTDNSACEAPTVPVPTVDWETVIAGDAQERFEVLGFEHPLWVLFSSGTTGTPKGIVHGHGGALLEQFKMQLIHCDLHPGDRYMNVASTSWVVWNALVFSLALGATAILLDGNPAYPALDRVWRVTAQERVTSLGLGAGYIHACLKATMRPGSDFDLSALASVQVTGSPLSEDGFRWVYAEVGDVWLASMSGGTDIASIFVGGVPTLPVRVGRIQVPALGVDVQAWDDSGARVVGERGELVVVKPLPSMPLYFWNDSHGTRYHDSYFSTFPGVWRHGDFIEFDVDGSSVIHGRSDSTLNRNGIRLGSADIYRAVEQLPEVKESMVVGAEFGADYYMPLFVVLAEGTDVGQAKGRIGAAIRDALSPRYLPDEIIPVRAIPHTRTGKKLEVPVKRLIQGAELTDVVDLGAVDDADLMREFADFARARRAVDPQAPAAAHSH